MSKTIEQVDPNAAQTHLQQSVLQPVFFQKLAQCGVQVTSQAEANAALELGVTLFADHLQKQAGAQKQASSLILRAHQGLSQHLSPKGDPADVQAVKVANELMRLDPALIQSAVAVQRASLAPAAA